MLSLYRKKHQAKTTLPRTYSGATSLYVVVFASLLFTVIAVGFVTIIMSEVSQTVNDELSQAAYDSALAGIEDAKLAIMKCINGTADEDYCNKINASLEDGACDAVGLILGREITESGTIIQEDTQTDAASESLQAYTCVTIKDTLSDYRSYLSATDTDSLRVVPLRAGAITSEITGIRISWYSTSDNNDYAYRNINDDGTVSFAPVSSGVSVPPTISVQLIQTDETFSLASGEIDYTVNGNSDRGTVFLVPASADSGFAISNNHIKNTGTKVSIVGTSWQYVDGASGFVKANDKQQTNYPYIIGCNLEAGSEFACSATIQLPNPVALGKEGNVGTRNANTAFLIISMPYDQPATDFAVEMCIDNDAIPGNCRWEDDENKVATADFVGAQYSIDSTGRASDVFNRVEARVELADIYFPYPQYAIQLPSQGNDSILRKDFWVTTNNCRYSNNSISSFSCSKFSGELSY